MYNDKPLKKWEKVQTHKVYFIAPDCMCIEMTNNLWKTTVVNKWCYQIYSTEDQCYSVNMSPRIHVWKFAPSVAIWRGGAFKR